MTLKLRYRLAKLLGVLPPPATTSTVQVVLRTDKGVEHEYPLTIFNGRPTSTLRVPCLERNLGFSCARQDIVPNPVVITYRVYQLQPFIYKEVTE